MFYIRISWVKSQVRICWLKSNIMITYFRRPPAPDAGCFKCNKGCMVSCPVLMEGGTFRSTGSITGRGYKIRQWVACDSLYVVYLANCKQCKSQYGGKSKAVFKKRHSNIKREREGNDKRLANSQLYWKYQLRR
jgi:hypothetical protein